MMALLNPMQANSKWNDSSMSSSFRESSDIVSGKSRKIVRRSAGDQRKPHSFCHRGAASSLLSPDMPRRSSQTIVLDTDDLSMASSLASTIATSTSLRARETAKKEKKTPLSVFTVTKSPTRQLSLEWVNCTWILRWIF